jgi:glyoxylase-like metal-dependent hydrolase (beta-lactamase superfamily II)
LNGHWKPRWSTFVELFPEGPIVKEIASGVYAETQYSSGNVGFIVTGAGVVCIDMPMLPSEARHWRAMIESVTDEPLVALIQTDYDQERVVSIPLFDVPVLAHDATCHWMRMYSSEKMIGQISDLLRRDGTHRRWKMRLPDITFSERLILYKGRREIHLLHGGGHSAAAGMVYLPEDSLIFAGDVVFYGAHPTMNLAETKRWLAALTALRKMSVDTIVPGHGALCDRGATHRLSEYIRDMRAAVRRHFQSGRSKSETSSLIIPEFMDAFSYRETDRDQVRLRIKGGSDRIYDEYRAEAKAKQAAARRQKKRG